MVTAHVLPLVGINLQMTKPIKVHHHDTRLFVI